MRALHRLPFTLAAVLAAAGCSTPDPLYCDESTPCEDPERPFCDLDGTYPASEGIDRTCIAEPTFTITLSDDDAQIRISGELSIDVTVDRIADFPGDITITAEDLPAGASAAPLTIPDGQTSGTLVIQAADSDPGAVSAARVVATAAPFASSADLRLLVLGPPGTLDPTFGTLGIAAEPEPITDDATALGQLPGGSLLVGGATFDSNVGAVLGFTSEGDVDGAFADDGVREFDLSALSIDGRLPYRFATQSDGRFVLAVGSDSGHLVLARFAADGSLDSEFASDGVVASVVTTEAVGVGAIAIGPDDEIVVGLEAQSAVATIMVVRFSSDGVRDESFAGGRIDIDRGTNPDVGAIEVLADGAVVVAARATDEASDRIPFLARFTPQGAVDETFGDDGVLVFAPDEAFTAVVGQENGDLIVGTTLTVNDAPTYRPVVRRVTSTGEPVSGFGVDGKIDIDLPEGASGGLAQLLQTEHGIIAVIESAITLARLDPVSGEIDSSFGQVGFATLPLAEGFARRAVRRTDGRIVVLADDDSFQFVLARFFE